MSQASIVINVSNQDQIHSNGLSGIWIVSGKKHNEEFAVLVVYPTPEIQDIGDGRSVVHWLKAHPLALDIVGMRSDAAAHGVGVKGNKEKWGLLLCEAQPDLPKDLMKALEAEMEFLSKNPPDVRYKRDPEHKIPVAINIDSPEVLEKKLELSAEVELQREEFVKYCRTLVQKKEVTLAKKNLMAEDQRLVAEGDRMWARPAEQANINELHRMACNRLGQERPWCYQPMELVDCPGCGAKTKPNVLRCQHCQGWLDEGIKALADMDPKERRVKMYPDQFDREPVTATGANKGR